nr:MAG TPA: tail tape measure [Caudoviricetes sp.]
MTTVADLLIKIGADGSGLSSELGKTKQEIQKTFSTNPINEFSGSVDTATGKVNSMLGSLTKFAGIAAAGFGLNAIVESAVNAGESLYQVQQRFNLTTAEAAKLSGVLKMTGGDVETAAKSIMRLDKNLANNTVEGKKAAAVLAQMGLSLTDSTGKMKPMNEQLETLAKGYKAANEAGQGQEFLMATLAPLVMEILPQVMDGLSHTANFIRQNKDEISTVIVTVTKLVAAYEALKLAKKGASVIGGVMSSVRDTVADRTADAQQQALTKAQERRINKAIADSDRMYAQMRREAIKTANQQNLSAEETQAYMAEKFTQIGLESAQAAERIRAEMTRAFAAVNVEAEKSAAVVSEAVKASAYTTETTTATKVEANNAVIASNAKVAESEVAVGAAAREAAAVKELAASAEVTANERVMVSNAAVGESAMAAGAASVRASEAATAATATTTQATTALGVAHEKAGVASVLSSQKSVAGLARLPGAIGKVTSVLFDLAGGWMGVAAATLYAAYCAYKYFNAKYEAAQKNTWTGDDGYTYTAHNGRIWRQIQEDNNSISADPTGQGSRANGGVSEEAVQEGTEAYAREYSNWYNAGGGKDFADAEAQRQAAEAAVNNVQIPSYDFSPDTGVSGVGGGTHVENEQTYDVRGGAIYNAGRWSGLNYGTGENEVVCTTYVENVWSDAGVSNAWNLGPWAPDWAENAGSAFHPTDAYGNGYEAHAGDAVITNNGGHVIMLDANASGYYAAAGSGRVSQHYDQDYREAFGGNIVGVISLTEFAGVTESGKALSISDVRKQAEQRAKDIANARKDLKGLENDLDKALLNDTGTEFEKSIANMNSQAKKYEDQIRKIKNVSKDIDTTHAEDLLKQWKIEEAAKAMEALTQRRLAFKTDLAKINADLKGDYVSVAQAEFEATVQSLDKQRKAKLKEIQATKDDYEALKEANEWYTAAYLQAVQKREDAEREAYEKSVQWSIKRGDTQGLMNALQSKGANDEKAWNDKKQALQTYYEFWQKAHMSTAEMITTGSGQIASGIQGVFEALANGSESAKDSLRSLGKVFQKTITQMVAQMAANKIATLLFGSWLGEGKSSNRFSFNGNLLDAASFRPYKPSFGVSMPAFASGGMVTAPTMGLIGEAGNDEAVFPLTDEVYSRVAKGIVQNQGQNGGTVAAPVINIINNSQSKINVQSSNYDNQMKRYIINVVVDAAETDEGGMARAIRNISKG